MSQQIAPLYLATSKEDFARLEERAKRLFDCYVVDSVIRLCVKTCEFFGEGIMVFPEDGNITSVSPTAGQCSDLGRLISHSSDRFVIELCGTKYVICYQNPDRVKK